MEAAKERGEYYDPDAGKALFSDFGNKWLISRVADPSTLLRYETAYRLHVAPVFAHLQVRAVKPSGVQAWIKDLSERFGPSTVITAVLVLQGILDLAVADEAIRNNPAKSPVVRVPGRQVSDIEVWDDLVVVAVIEAHPDQLRAIPELAASLGMREGELFGLAQEDLDLDEERVVRVRRQVKRIGRVFVFALPKNDRERAIPLSDWAVQVLRRHIGQYPPRSYTLPWEKPDGKPHTCRLLFRWPLDAQHVKSRSYSETVWKPAIARAGIIPGPEKDKRGRARYATTRKEGIHQLRHYFASVMLAGGVSVKELSEYLGHADPGFTLRVYAHLLPSSYARARTVINDRFSHLMTAPGSAAFERQATQSRDQPHGTETEQTRS